MRTESQRECWLDCVLFGLLSLRYARLTTWIYFIEFLCVFMCVYTVRSSPSSSSNISRDFLLRTINSYHHGAGVAAVVATQLPLSPQPRYFYLLLLSSSTRLTFFPFRCFRRAFSVSSLRPTRVTTQTLTVFGKLFYSIIHNNNDDDDPLSILFHQQINTVASLFFPRITTRDHKFMKIEKYWIDPRRDQNPFRKWWSKRTIHWMVWQTKRFIVWVGVFIRRTWSSFGGFSLHNAQAQSDVMKLTDDGRHIVVFSISIRLYSRYLFVLFRLLLLLLFDKHCDAHVPRDHSISILRHDSTRTRKASQLNSRVIPKNGEEMLWLLTTEVSSAAYIYL